MRKLIAMRLLLISCLGRFNRNKRWGKTLMNEEKEFEAIRIMLKMAYREQLETEVVLSFAEELLANETIEMAAKLALDQWDIL